MKNINNFFIIGRQTRELDERSFKYTNSGSAVLTLSIAVNGSKKVGDTWQDEASFFDVTVWGKTAETLNQFIHKGKLLAVRGHLQQQRWQDETGANHSKVALIADEVELLSRDDNNNGGYNDNAGGYAPQQQAPQYNNGYTQQQSSQYIQQQASAPQYAPQYPQNNGQQLPPQAEAVRHAFKGQATQGETVDPLDPPF